MNFNLFRKVSKKKLSSSRSRHIMKTFTWRIIATTTTFLISFILTGSIEIGASIAGVEFFAKMALYYFHERVWYRVDVGEK